MRVSSHITYGITTLKSRFSEQYNKTGGKGWPKDRLREYSCTTGNSSLRNHLKKFHKDEYLEQCEKNGWPMLLKLDPSEAVLARASDPSRIRPDVPPYSVDNLLRAITKFIVIDDQASTKPATYYP
jgi:hypothetical protein